jgi:hypothetical protein
MSVVILRNQRQTNRHVFFLKYQSPIVRDKIKLVWKTRVFLQSLDLTFHCRRVELFFALSPLGEAWDDKFRLGLGRRVREGSFSGLPPC